jgi:hypothetical protein
LTGNVQEKYKFCQQKEKRTKLQKVHVPTGKERKEGKSEKEKRRKK